MNWIPVTERLPEYTYRAGREGFIFVLAASEEGVNQVMFCNGIFHQPLLSHLDGEKEVWVPDAHTKFSKTVTHWMPLPTPPGR